MKLLLVVTLILLAPREAQPCSSEPLRGIDFTVLPADGSEAPANTLVWIADPAAGNELALVQRGTIVPTTVRTIRVGGEVETVLLVLAPRSPLATNEIATVTRAGQPVSEFFVTAMPLSTAPDAPVIREVTVVSEYYGCYSCPESSRITISRDDNAEMVLLVRDGATPTGLPEAVLASSASDKASVYGLAEGTHILQVINVDLAGQMSSSRQITVTIPPRVASCAAARGASLPMLVCLLLVLRRRHARA
jgi:hypothetical protein